MPKANVSSVRGGAKIEKQGHTTNGNFGSDPNASGKYGVRKGQARELNVSATKK